MDEEALRELIRRVMAESPDVVTNIQRGKAGGGVLVGRVLMQVPADEDRDEPSRIFTLLEDELSRA